MHSKLDEPYWGKAVQPDGGVPAGIGAPQNQSAAFGAQCDNKILNHELSMKNISPHNLNARQAVMCLKQNFEGPHVVLPYHCVYDAPVNINVYTDGSWKNPRKFYFALGGAGVWWPSRTFAKLPLSTAEKELAHHQVCSDGVRLCAAIGGYSGSSTRNELAAGIVAMCAHGPVHPGSDSEVFVDKANAIVEGLKTNPARKCHHNTTSDGDLWMYFVKIVKHKGLHSVKFTWVKGHATDEHVAQGISTQIDKEGNANADTCADLGVECHGEGLVHLANLYNKRHGLYTDFMTLVVKHIVEAHMIHRELSRIHDIKAANANEVLMHKWTFKPMVFVSPEQRTRKLHFTASIQSFPKLCQNSTCILKIEKFLKFIYICEQSAGVRCITWIELYILYRICGNDKPLSTTPHTIGDEAKQVIPLDL